MRINKIHSGPWVFLLLLLVAPEVPIGGAASDGSRSTLSIAFLGIGFWFVATDFRITIPLGHQYLVLPIFCLFLFYLLCISILSFEIRSIAFAVQYAVIGLSLCVLYTAYFNKCSLRKEITVAHRSFGIVGALYIIAILVSIWTGPLYPAQVGSVTKHYGAIDISRAAGFSSGANQAGAVAGVILAFFIFVCPYRNSIRSIAIVASILGIAASLSRGAMLSVLLAFTIWGGLFFCYVFIGGMITKSSIRFIGRILALCTILMVVGTIYFFYDKMAQDHLVAAIDRLGIGTSYGEDDIVLRVSKWVKGVSIWIDKPTTEALFGTGFRSTANVSRKSGALVSSHNSYIEFLNDVGVIGLGLFMTVIILTVVKNARDILRGAASRETHFCFVSILIMCLQSITETHFYSVVFLSLLVYIITLSETRAKRRINTIWTRENIGSLRSAV